LPLVTSQKGGGDVQVNVGRVTSLVQLTILEVVAVNPQASVAVNVLVCDLEHPLLVTAPSEDVMVGVLQSSVADALPNAALSAADVGLHPSGVSLPLAVIDGVVVFSVQVAVRELVKVLPHASVAIHVLVCERKHPPLTMDPSLDVTVAEPQASVAVALPNAATIAAEVGLHPRLPLAGVPVAVIVGPVTSAVQVAVLEVVAVLPQASVAVNVRVCERKHPLL